MTGAARKLVLPAFVLTETASADDAEAVEVRVPQSDRTEGAAYHVCPKRIAQTGERRDGKPTWVKHQFNRYPVVLDSDGVPWAEANIYILSRLEQTLAPSMDPYAAIAEDLADYRQFLDETGLDWTSFPRDQQQRPTYRYSGHLKYALHAGEVAPGSAKRRMGTVLGLYRWLMSEGVLVPENPPWRAGERFITFKDVHGFKQSKTVVTSDISIKTPVQQNPYDGCIVDGGTLRPLPPEEQEWLVEALIAAGNPEMTFIHLSSLRAGARIQTVLTLKVRHVLTDTTAMADAQEIRIPVGPGTGVDTKYDKRQVLHFPVSLYRQLQAYARSTRAKKRRERAVGGDTVDQYLFLSAKGAPLYYSKEDNRAFDPLNKLRHAKKGGAVRQFITEHVIPYVQAKHAPRFHYKVHDLRATFGMNLTDHQLKLVASGDVTLHQAREFVKTRMGHASAATTDRYLQYRDNLKLVRHTADGYADHLTELGARVLQGVL